jgi:DNA repair protein RadC
LSSFELGERSKVKKEKETTIRCAEDISNLLLPQVQSLNQEYLFVLYLNTRKKVLSEKTLFIGSLNESLVNPREIFKRGLEINASAVIVAHNHPSGNPSPSEADINSTKELIEVGKLMGIEVLDHVILGKNTYWSLAENGLI